MMEILSYTFIQYALAGTILAGLACGLMGCYVVTRRMVFLTGGVAHASLGGVGLFALMGLNPTLGATTAALLTSWSIESLSKRKEIRQDSAIAMLWALGMGIGVMCSFLTPTFLPSLTSYLFGNILLISLTDLIFLGIITLAVVLGMIFYANQISCITFDPEFAKSRHLPVKTVEYTAITLAALLTVACIRVTGVMMVIALFSVPQITAGLFTCHFRQMAWISAAIGVTSCLAGLCLSYLLNIPSGAAIILTAILIYYLLSTIKRLKKRYGKRARNLQTE